MNARILLPPPPQPPEMGMMATLNICGRGSKHPPPTAKQAYTSTHAKMAEGDNIEREERERERKCSGKEGRKEGRKGGNLERGEETSADVTAPKRFVVKLGAIFFFFGKWCVGETSASSSSFSFAPLVCWPNNMPHHTRQASCPAVTTYVLLHPISRKKKPIF